MNVLTRIRIVLTIAVLALAASLLVMVRQHTAGRALEVRLTAAQTQAAENARLQEEVERLRGVEAEAKRLREENMELPRLRGDVARLRREVAAATNVPTRPSGTPAVKPLPTGASMTNFTAFTGTAHASLAPGHTLVMGGWPMEAGKRTLALFTPETTTAAQEGGIVIGGIYVQVPEAILSGPGWEQFAAVSREANHSAVFDAEQAKSLIEALQKMEGVDILSSPRLMTTSGTAGTISIGDENGAGLSTTLSPVLAADGQTVELTVSNALRVLPSSAGGQRP